MIYFIVILCFIISAFSESIMDTLQFHYYKSIFNDFKNKSFWNPEISWKNKYKNNDPNQGEKFKFSTTLFVGLTDGWHFFKLVKNVSLFFGLFLILTLIYNFYLSLILIILLRLIYGVVFTLGYDKILIKKK